MPGGAELVSVQNRQRLPLENIASFSIFLRGKHINTCPIEWDSLLGGQQWYEHVHLLPLLSNRTHANDTGNPQLYPSVLQIWEKLERGKNKPQKSILQPWQASKKGQNLRVKTKPLVRLLQHSGKQQNNNRSASRCCTLIPSEQKTLQSPARVAEPPGQSSNCSFPVTFSSKWHCWHQGLWRMLTPGASHRSCEEIKVFVRGGVW